MQITSASQTIGNLINIMQAYGMNTDSFRLIRDNGTSATLFIYPAALAILRANDLIDL